MSVLNKLEVTYLNLLRGALLVIATILIAVALGAGIKGLIGITGFGSGDVRPENVSVDQVIQALTEKPKEEVVTPKAETSEKKTDDPYSQQYEKIVTTSIGFIKKYSNNSEDADKKEFITFLSAKTNLYETDDLKASYINGLSDTVDKALKNELIIQRTVKVKSAKQPALPIAPTHQTQEVTNEDGTVSIEEVEVPAEPLPSMQDENSFNESPLAIVDEVIARYTDMFNANIANANQANAAKMAEKFADKASALVTLYVAAGAFFLFLSIIFTLILVKIERNLRVMSEKP
jgi:hypothetical protein